jgi:hypothetical protein
MLPIGPATRLKLIVIGLVGLVVSTGISLKAMRDYYDAGTEPSEMTMAQVRDAATRTPFAVRWVRLTEPVQLDCSSALQWMEEDTASTIVLAFDESKQQPFWLQYNQPVTTCAQLKSIELQGILMQPEKFWIKQGMVKPSSQYPLMELKVGQTSSDFRKNALSMGAANLIFLAMLGLWFLSRPPKPQTHFEALARASR